MSADTIDVKLPNGTLVKGLPASTTQAELQVRLRKGGHVEDADSLQQQMNQTAMQRGSAKTFNNLPFYEKPFVRIGHGMEKAREDMNDLGNQLLAKIGLGPYAGNPHARQQIMEANAGRNAPYESIETPWDKGTDIASGALFDLPAAMMTGGAADALLPAKEGLGALSSLYRSSLVSGAEGGTYGALSPGKNHAKNALQGLESGVDMGIGVPVALGAGLKAGSAAWGAGRRAVRLASKAGRAAQAEQDIRRSAAPAFEKLGVDVGTLEPNKPPLEGMQQTLGEATGNPTILSMEKAGYGKILPPAAREQAREVNGEALLNAARGLGTRVDKENPRAVSQNLSHEAHQAISEIKGKIKQAWESVDPEGKMHIPKSNISSMYKEVLGSLSPLTRSDLPNSTLDKWINALPDNPTLNDVKELRTHIRLAKESAFKSGDPNVGYALKEMESGLSARLMNGIAGPEESQAIKDANILLDHAHAARTDVSSVVRKAQENKILNDAGLENEFNPELYKASSNPDAVELANNPQNIKYKSTRIQFRDKNGRPILEDEAQKVRDRFKAASQYTHDMHQLLDNGTLSKISQGKVEPEAATQTLLQPKAPQGVRNLLLSAKNAGNYKQTHDALRSALLTDWLNKLGETSTGVASFKRYFRDNKPIFDELFRTKTDKARLGMINKAAENMNQTARFNGPGGSATNMNQQVRQQMEKLVKRTSPFKPFEAGVAGGLAAHMAHVPFLVGYGLGKFAFPPAGRLMEEMANQRELALGRLFSDPHYGVNQLLKGKIENAQSVLPLAYKMSLPANAIINNARNQ